MCKPPWWDDHQFCFQTYTISTPSISRPVSVRQMVDFLKPPKYNIWQEFKWRDTNGPCVALSWWWSLRSCRRTSWCESSSHPHCQLRDLTRKHTSHRSDLFNISMSVFCPGFQKGRVPSEKSTFSAVNWRKRAQIVWWTEEKGHN